MSEGRYGIVSTSDGNTYGFAVVPFVSSAIPDSVEAALRWNEDENGPTTANILNTSEGVGEQSEDYTETVVGVDDRQIRSETQLHIQESSDDVRTMKPIGPPGGGICYRCDCSTVVDRHCTNYNLSCIAWHLAAVGISCNPYTGVVTCMLGSGVAIGPWVTGDNYNI